MNFTLSSSDYRIHYLQNPLLWGLSGLFVAFAGWSGFNTPDLANWLLENMLTFSFVAVLVSFYPHFRFSDLSYSLMLLFLLLHLYGSHYGYTQNPTGQWLRETLDLRRNAYDRVVHFSFGLTMAYAARDLLRHQFRIRGRYTYLRPIEVILSLSAFFELVEWVVADRFFPEQATKYLGMQGDLWDAQKDIFFACLGACLTMGTVWLRNRLKKQPS